MLADGKRRVVKTRLLTSDLKGSKMADYIPDTDGTFQVWANNFMDYANGHLADLGLTATELTGSSTPSLPARWLHWRGLFLASR